MNATHLSNLQHQLQLFWLALAFFTRIPIPKHVEFTQAKLNQASRYFSLVGWIVGLICVLTYWVSSQLWSTEISVLISMVVGFFLTGGFHEDGLADTADGFGGGWTTDKKLSIMKDSRLGSYGSLALWSVLTLKFFTLSQQANVIIAIVIAHPLSRSVSSVLISILPYVSETDGSKSKPLAERQSSSDWIINIAISSIALWFVAEAAVTIVIVLLVLTAVLAWFYRRQIGGFTGDTLGAAQQISEVVIYLTLLITISEAQG